MPKKLAKASHPERIHAGNDAMIQAIRAELNKQIARYLSQGSGQSEVQNAGR